MRVDECGNRAGARVHQIAFARRVGCAVGDVHVMGQGDALRRQGQMRMQQGPHGGFFRRPTQTGKAAIQTKVGDRPGGLQRLSQRPQGLLQCGAPRFGLHL